VNDTFKLFDDELVDEDFLPNQVLGLVLRIVGVAKTTIVPKFKL